jgi:hypothetical protein
MCGQTPDRIFFAGSEHLMFDEPLSSRAGLPSFMAISTVNHRGYEAVWAVVGSRLFIVSLSGSLSDWVPGDSRNGLELVFSSALEPVLADWYSGELTLLSGRLIDDSESDPIYEHVTVLAVEKGHIRSHRSFSREYVPVRRFDPILLAAVSFLEEIGPDLVRQLQAANIHAVGDLIQFRESELVKTAGLSLDAVTEVSDALACRGLTLGAHLSGWPPKTGLEHLT